MTAAIARRVIADYAVRIAVGTLFAGLCVNILNDFVHTGHITGLLLLMSESLVVVLTLIRRQATLVDRSVAAGVVTVLSAAGPTLLQPSGDIPPLGPDMATGVISAIGLLLVLSGKLTLGRSFGLVPANRGVVVSGPYTAMRHPIYTGYLVSHLAFLAAHPSMWNIAILSVADGSLIVRALMEERVLSRDASYRAYCRRVGWHLLPGVF